ncbi:MAG: aldehyde dehydrogenase family protein [Chloroflexota bacterium]
MTIAPTTGLNRLNMFIGGEWQSAQADRWIQSIDPTTEKVIGEFPDSDDTDVARAVSAAREAMPGWRSLGWKRRADALRELAMRIRERQDKFAMLDTSDAGMPVTAMRRDARNASDHLLYFAGLASELKGTTLEAPHGMLNYTLREPFGVVGRIIPFNHPFQFAAAKIAAPLAAGNTVILKPAEQTSLSALELGAVAQDIFPSGVLNIVTGRGASAGAALVRHPDVPRIAFTGSVPTGRTVLREAAEHIKVVTLELGGKNPMIVFPDVDVDAAARGAVAGMNLVGGQGQSCGSNSRLFVHESIHDRFLDALVRCVQNLKVGDPTHEDTDVGPLAFGEHFDRVMRLISEGTDEGAVLVSGGSRPTGLDAGYFVEPAIFDRVGPEMCLAREEIFGPVVSVSTWLDLDEVIRAANALPYGLTANIWTNNLSLAHQTAGAMQAGYVWINGSGVRLLGAPFGGYKLSGMGKENSFEELLSYTQQKNICVSFVS